MKIFEKKFRRAQAAGTLLALFGSMPAAAAVVRAAVPQEVALAAPQTKIAAASNVRVRSAPQIAATEVTRLKLGTLVTTAARTAAEEEIGGRRAYWYKIDASAATNNQSGWVFGGLLLDYDAARRGEIARRLIDERLKAERVSFDEGVELHEFVTAALMDAKTADERAGLELAQLRALERAASTVPYDAREQPKYRDFFKSRERVIVYHELAGAWQLNSEAIWDLEKKYRGTPTGERVAWEAAQQLLLGECEGDELCQFHRLHLTEGRYLTLYPTGAHAAEVLRNLGEALKSAELGSTMRAKGGDKFAAEARADLRKALAELRPAVAKSTAPEKASVLKKIDALVVPPPRRR